MKTTAILRAMFSARWAITQEALTVMAAIASRDTPAWLQGEVEALSARPGRRLEGGMATVIRGQVGVIEIAGPIFPKATMFSEISGAASLQDMAHELTALVENPSIKGIVLNIDSPGGTVSGTNEFALMIKEAIKRKPVWAYVSNLGASAAYWIASAAESITLERTASVGSIGIILTAYKDDEEDTVRFVSSVSPRKLSDPESDQGRADLQAHVDELGQIFVNAIAENRGIKEKAILELGGRTIIGVSAVKAGFADSVGTLESVIATLQAQISRGAFESRGALAEEQPMKFGDTKAGKYIASLLNKESSEALAAKPPEGLSDEESATIEQMRTSLRAETLKRFDTEAAAFVAGLFANNKIFPFEAKALTADYLQAAIDDFDHPLSEGTRVQRLKTRCDSLKAHKLTDELVPEPASTRTIPGNAGDDPEKAQFDDEYQATLAWAKKYGRGSARPAEVK